MGSVGSNTVDFLTWRREWHDKYNVTPDYDIDEGSSSMENLTPQQRKSIEKELDKFIKEFPELKDMYVTITREEKLQEDSWAAGYDAGYGNLMITDKIFDKDAYNKTLDKDWYAGVFTSFHPQGTNNMSSISHELGHVVVDRIARKLVPIGDNYNAFINQYKDIQSKVEHDITDTAAKSLGDKHNNLVGHISHYASTNRGETIAEAISDYIANGKKANKYSIAIVKEVKKRLK